MSELLRKIHLFDNLTEKELEKIQNICIKETHAKDTMMFFEGDPGNRCYLIIKERCASASSYRTSARRRLQC
jgi:signal-transduction protein with cAMP-binding, CBS, and nucleotidyltransferase domain